MIITRSSAGAHHLKSGILFIALAFPGIWLTDMFVSWFHQNPGDALLNNALPAIFVLILWSALFYLGQRWADVISYVLFFLGFMMLLNGVTMAFELKPPPPKPPFMTMRPDTEAAFRDMYGLDVASMSKPRVPSWPLPALIFTAIFGGILLAAGGWGLLWKGEETNQRALEELEEKYPLLKGFSEHYNRELASWMEAQEKKRRAAIRHKVLVCLGGMVLLGVLLLGMKRFNVGPYTLHIDIAVILVFLYGTYKLAEWPVARLKAEIKKNLIEEVCKFLKLGYSPYGENWDMQRFQDMNLLPYYDRCYNADFFTGNHDKVSFRICRSKLITTGKHGGTQFIGALIEMTFPEAFFGTTKILTDRGKIINKLMSAVAIKENRVNLSYSAFEKAFEAYSSDQVEARALLTPDVIENFMNLSQLLSGKNSLQAAFNGHSLLISVSCDHELFDMGGMGTPMSDQTRVSRFLEEVAVVHNIINTIGVQKRARG